MTEKEFNLLDEAWIPVVYADGKQVEIGLKKLFENAHIIRCLAGEIPTQDVTTLRFLIAVNYRVFMSTDTDGSSSELFDGADAYSRWSAFWSKGMFGEQYQDYLEKFRDRFFLFHPDRPFYQYPLSKGSSFDAKKLLGTLSESSNKVRMFSPVSGEKKRAMEYGQAARWLLHLVGYDDASLKPINKGGEKLPAAKIGWSGRLGFIYIKGNNLFETIMLNTVPVDRSNEPYPEEKPVWEQDALVMDERRNIPVPRSPVGVLTVQNRRVKLIRDDGKVVRYEEIVGDQFPDYCMEVENMTLWKLDKEKNWIPKSHTDPSVALWRDYAPLLAKGADRLQPGVIRWCSELTERNLINHGRMEIGMVSVGYLGGAMAYSFDEIVSDSLSVSNALLAKIGDQWNIRISDMLEKTDKAIWLFGQFVSKVIVLCGVSEGSENLRKKYVSEQSQLVYSALDIRFREWLLSVDPESTDMEDKIKSWYNGILIPIIFNTARDFLSECDPRTYIGIPVNADKEIFKKDGSSDPQSAIVQYHRLKGAVNHVLNGD